MKESFQQALPHRSANADSSSYFTRTHPIGLAPRTYHLDPVYGLRNPFRWLHIHINATRHWHTQRCCWSALTPPQLAVPTVYIITYTRLLERVCSQTQLCQLRCFNDYN